MSFSVFASPLRFGSRYIISAMTLFPLEAESGPRPGDTTCAYFISSWPLTTLPRSPCPSTALTTSTQPCPNQDKGVRYKSVPGPYLALEESHPSLFVRWSLHLRDRMPGMRDLFLAGNLKCISIRDFSELLRAM